MKPTGKIVGLKKGERHRRQKKLLRERSVIAYQKRGKVVTDEVVSSSKEGTSEPVRTSSEESADMNKPSASDLLSPFAPLSDQDDRVRRGILAPSERPSVGRAYMRALRRTTGDYERILENIRANIRPTDEC